MVMALGLVGSPPQGPSSEAVCLSVCVCLIVNNGVCPLIINTPSQFPAAELLFYCAYCLGGCAHSEMRRRFQGHCVRRHLSKSLHTGSSNATIVLFFSFFLL